MAPPSSDERQFPQPDLIGTVLADRYRIEELLGDGGMGQVYGGTQVTLRKPIAIKVLKQEFSNDKILVERFLREARAASMIGHENVVDIVDFGQVPGGSVFFVMERLIGHDLDSLIASQGRLPWSRARDIALQVAGALHAAHRVGVIHRDIKPGNIFLIQRRNNPDYVKVVDFGIAKIDDPNGNVLTRAGSVFGTAAYMAPEQASGSTVDGRTDIYSLGCVIFEMLTGRLPFSGTNFVKILSQQIKDPPPRPREVCPQADVTDEVEALIMCALAKRPEDRFADMGVFARAIAAANGGSAVPRSAPPAEVPRKDHSQQVTRDAAPATVPEPSANPTGTDIAPESLAAGVDAHLIGALAFLYVTFSHATDGRSTDTEMATLSERLHRWAPHATADQLSGMLRYAIDNFGALAVHDRPAHAKACADWIAGRGTATQRQTVLADLQAIALADGQVSPGEESFIADIAARLGIPLGPTADQRLYALAFLYLAFGASTGESVSPEEMRTLGNNLRKWAAGHSLEQIGDVLKRVVVDYRSLSGDKLVHARAFADSLKQHSGPEQLRQILADLWAIAGADGYVSDDEQRFIMETAKRFELA